MSGSNGNKSGFFQSLVQNNEKMRSMRPKLKLVGSLSTLDILVQKGRFVVSSLFIHVPAFFRFTFIGDVVQPGFVALAVIKIKEI